MKEYKDCCKPFHEGAIPESALLLMRSRYSAYALNLPDYIIATTHPSNPHSVKDKVSWKRSIASFSRNFSFRKLEILDFKEKGSLATVTFVAYLSEGAKDATFTERSSFEKINDRWFYLSGELAEGRAPHLALDEGRSEKVFPSLESLSDSFDGILLDAYGVFWGGNEKGLLPGCKETMERMVASGKIVGILSNATQLAKHEIEKLQKHGLIQGKHFHFLITSGTVARQLFLEENLAFPTPNKKFILFGAPHPKFSSHQALFQETSFQETGDLSKADFIYISVPHIDGKDQIDQELFRKDVGSLKDLFLPMLCVNPDRFAHEGNPPCMVVRQGSIAAMYEEIGGKVHYIGKPSSKMYDAAMSAFSDFGLSDKKRVLMVGDTPETDIRGAKNVGMPSALILKTGIMAERIACIGFKKAFEELPSSDYPDFFIEYMGKNGL